MKRFLRSGQYLGLAALAGVAMMMPPGASAQGRGVVRLLEEPTPLLHSTTQGYLGVELADVDQQKAQSLKLKEVRGAVITLIDHDAPAGQIGLKVNDVILQLNGQAVEGAEQLRRMLREIPAGRKVTLEISRDGSLQTLTAQLADRRAMEQDVWNRIGSGGGVYTQAPPGMGILSGGGNAPLSGGFHMPFFGSSLNVGALVEPLTSQMAEYLGVPGGLMIKQVARKSEAAAAGMKAFDVILKVGSEPIATLSDWERALHANQGKPVQVTVLRDRKQQTLTLQVDSKRHSMMEGICLPGDCAMVADLGPELTQDAVAAAEALSQQAGSMRISPEQAEQFRLQAEKLRDSLKAENFKIDQKQMDQLKQQMEELRKSFKAENFKIDQRQLDQLKQQMDELKRQMEELKAQRFDGHI